MSNVDPVPCSTAEILKDGKPCDRCGESVEVIPHNEHGWMPAPDAGWRLPKRSHGWHLLCPDCYSVYRGLMVQLGEVTRRLSEDAMLQLITRLSGAMIIPPKDGPTKADRPDECATCKAPLGVLGCSECDAELCASCVVHHEHGDDG